MHGRRFPWRSEVSESTDAREAAVEALLDVVDDHDMRLIRREVETLLDAIFAPSRKSCGVWIHVDGVCSNPECDGSGTIEGPSLAEQVLGPKRGYTEQMVVDAVEASLTDQYFTKVVPAEDRADAAEAALDAIEAMLAKKTATITFDNGSELVVTLPMDQWEELDQAFLAGIRAIWSGVDDDERAVAIRLDRVLAIVRA
jgi:hypothetical protein